jgi:phenylacetate-CoA ligase
MYERLYADIDFGYGKLTLPQLLNRLPVVSKADLLATPLEERTNRRYNVSDLSVESTTGSTGQPFSLYVEKSYKSRRNLRFLRSLISVGYKPWQRMMLLTDRYAEPKRVGINRYYVPVEQPTSAILDAYRSIRPDVLYGFLTPLRLLAERLAAAPQSSHQPHLVISTAEMLDRHTRQILENTFDCAISDFYGLTEMGLVAWQPPGAERYSMWSNSVLTELMPDPSGQDRYRMIMTNLDLTASPIIRFDSGDLTGVRWMDGQPQLVAFEGRRIDTIIRRDGSELSPYRITDALRYVAGLRRFKITQRAVTDILVELDVDHDQSIEAAQNTRRILEELLGTGINLDIQLRHELIPAGTRKFRPVESRVVRP